MTMNTEELISDIKKRYHHNEFKLYLKEKYQNKLLLADQSGLWKVDINFISTLSNLVNNVETTILVDTYDNPVKVNIRPLLDKSTILYNSVMESWLSELSQYKGLR